jgi:hypothetical protein
MFWSTIRPKRNFRRNRTSGDKWMEVILAGIAFTVIFFLLGRDLLQGGKKK